MRELYFYIFVSVLFCLGVFLSVPRYWPLPVRRILNRLPDSLPEKLGDAFIIACILAIGVDEFVTYKLFEEATRDVLSFAAGHLLPPNARIVVSNLIKAPFIRDDLKLRIRLEPLCNQRSNETELVRLTLLTDYVVENLTGSPVSCPFRTSIEKSM